MEFGVNPLTGLTPNLQYSRLGWEPCVDQSIRGEVVHTLDRPGLYPDGSCWRQSPVLAIRRIRY